MDLRPTCRDRSRIAPLANYESRATTPTTTPRGTPVPSMNVIGEVLADGERVRRRTVPIRSGAPASVEATLRLVEAVGDDDLDCVGRTRHHRFTIVVCIERREHVVGNSAWVAPSGPTHADP